MLSAVGHLPSRAPLSSTKPYSTHHPLHQSPSSTKRQSSAGLAQLGERQTEVKLREVNLKVVCSIHTNRTVERPGPGRFLFGFLSWRRWGLVPLGFPGEKKKSPVTNPQTADSPEATSGKREVFDHAGIRTQNHCQSTTPESNALPLRHTACNDLLN